MEAQIEKRICRKLSQRNYIANKQYGYVGIPDRLVITPTGDLFFIEFKHIGGKLSKHQKRYILELKKINVVVVIYIEGDLPKNEIAWTLYHEIPVVHNFEQLIDIFEA